MKSYLAKVLSSLGAAALLAVSVNAQQHVRYAKKAAVFADRAFSFRSGGTTGGMIIVPAPTALSPIRVLVPLPLISR